MSPPHASLCFLSFERPQFIREAVDSAVEHAEYPVEVIVHDDGSRDSSVVPVLLELLCDKITRLILSPIGRNEGVGAAFNRCAKVATGDPIVKLDQDLVFYPGWLRRVVEIHRCDPEIAGVGLFKYPVEPCRWQDMELEYGAPCETPYHYVRDFVSSAISMPRRMLWESDFWPEHSSAFAEDVEWKVGMQRRGRHLALPDVDLAHNRGFGVGPSTVVMDAGTVRQINDGPRIIS